MKVTNACTQMAALVLVGLLVGCASQKSWVYKPNSYTRPTTTLGKTVAVQPFDDDRLNENKNMVAMYLIPLVPCGWQDFHVPEGVQMHCTTGMWMNYKPTEDFPKALASELVAMGMFKEAYFDYRKGNSDYAITGRILSTDYNGKLITYGLSVYGPLLWFIGFPATHVTNDLAVELKMKDAVTGKTILSRKYQAQQYRKVSWIYAMDSDFNYAELLAQVYRKFGRDVQAALAVKR